MANYEKVVDFDRLALYDEKIKQVIGTKADPADIPTKLSELTNDGDGTTGSEYATKGYVDENGGKIDTVKVNGTAQTITDKEIDITVPTTVAELTDAADYATDAEVQTALQNSGFQTAQDVEDAIADAVADISGVSYEIVQALPATGETGVIYLISDPDGVSPDVYAEYIYANNQFEKIGTTGSMDLTGYVQESDITLATNSDVNALFA